MKKVIQTLLALTMAFYVVGASAKTNAVSIDRVVAIVNDDIITESALDEHIASIKLNLSQNNTPLPPDDILTQQVLQQLINVKLQLQLAKQSGIRVSDEEVNQTITHIARDNNMTAEQLYKSVTSKGQNYENFRKEVLNELTIHHLRQRDVASRITVTDQEVEDYLRSASAKEASNTEYRIENILIALPEAPTPTDTEKARALAEKLLADVKQGNDFRELAVSNSGGEQALQGGDLGFRKLAQLPTLFAAEVSHMKKGDVAGPIHTANGFHLIKMADIRGTSMDAPQVEEYQIQQILLKLTPDVNVNTAKNQLESLRTKALTKNNFLSLARNNTQDTFKGEAHWVNPNDLPPAFLENITSLAINDISEPFIFDNALYIVKLVDKHLMEKNQQLIRETKELIFQRKLEENVQNWITQLRENSYLEIIPEKDEKTAKAIKTDKPEKSSPT